MKRTLIHNATIVNEGRSVQGSVVIEGDRIAEVLTYGKKLSVPCDETIDATGCCLLPGVIERIFSPKVVQQPQVVSLPSWICRTPTL